MMVESSNFNKKPSCFKTIEAMTVEKLVIGRKGYLTMKGGAREGAGVRFQLQKWCPPSAPCKGQRSFYPTKWCFMFLFQH